MENQKAIMVSCEGSDELRRSLRILSVSENTSVAKLVRESIEAHLGKKIAALQPIFFAEHGASKLQNDVAKRHSKKGAK